jgi:hypothetical protein
MEESPETCSIQLTWDAHVEAVSFVVRRKKLKMRKMSFLEVPGDEVVSGDKARIEIDVEPGTEFMYWVAAVTAQGDQSLWSEPVSITTPTPARFKRLARRPLAAAKSMSMVR